MSVRKRPNSPFFHYRFKIDGASYSGSTKETAAGKSRRARRWMNGMVGRGEWPDERFQ